MEAEMRRIVVRSQPEQIVILKKTFTKKGWWSSPRCRPSVQTPVPEK
jgi:hypothetical protein